ncbi:alpha/beta fold hydrolase [Sulfitobacter porphyrae]|uniref:Alpha/beta fold hydrolase n=1 Tax=Sulfitobacter porphyrae TaxID=1246864 RepID=A0ABW2B781_9RHOB
MTRLNRFLTGTTSALTAIALSTTAYSQDFTFSIHHFHSPKAPAQTVLLEPWVAAVEEASGGRIKFEIFPSMSLGGAPPELYSQVRDGVADLTWTLPGYTPGTFPRTEVFGLPSVHVGDARATNLAIQDMMDELAPDFEDVHPIALNNQLIAYRHHSGGSGPCVEFANSLGSDQSLWDGVIDKLGRGFDTLTYYLCGHGLSGASAGYDFTYMGDDLIALMDHLDLRDVIFCGGSVGGMVAQAVAARCPKRLRG